jgi:O-antigen/teichoic acid export membrane protein
MFSTDILKVFTQPDFYSAKAVVPFLCASVFFSNAYFIVSIGINITKKLQHTIWITILCAAINIGLNFILTPTYGPVGAAFCIMFANFLIFILTYFISQRYYRVDYKYGKILIMLIPAIAIMYISYYMNMKLMPRIVVSVIFLIFSALYIYNNYRNSEEFINLMKKIRKLRKGKAMIIPEDEASDNENSENHNT